MLDKQTLLGGRGEPSIPEAAGIKMRNVAEDKGKPPVEGLGEPLAVEPAEDEPGEVVAETSLLLAVECAVAVKRSAARGFLVMSWFLFAPFLYSLTDIHVPWPATNSGNGLLSPSTRITASWVA